MKPLYSALQNTKHELKRGSVPADNLKFTHIFHIIILQMPPHFQYEQIEKEDSMGKIEQGFFGERYRSDLLFIGFD